MRKLADALLQSGYKLRPEGGGNYRVTGRGGLIVKDDYWFQHSTGKRGNARELFELLAGNDRTLLTNANSASKKTHRDHREPINIRLDFPCFRDTISKDGYDYLLRKRQIDAELLDILIHRKLIREDLHGYLCFIGNDPDGRMGCVTRRAVCTGHMPQKSEIQGSDKSCSFSLPVEARPHEAILAEGPVDILSIACLQQKKHKGEYFRCHKIATCGPPTLGVLQRLIRLGITKVWLCFDTDPPGQNMTRQIFHLLKNHLQVRRLGCPILGKDPNDWWISNHGTSHQSG